MKSRRPRSVRATRWIVLAAVAVPAGVLLLYAVLVHWLLSGPRLRAEINARPESTLIDYDEASSVWPGRLRLKNLSIRGSDQNVQYIIRLADARVEYSVASLFARRFRALRVQGTGLSFRLRNKLEPADARKPAAALAPPIPGFTDPPLRSKSPPAPPDDGANPWSVDIRNISVDRFEEIWLDGYHFQGAAHLTGGFFLRPGLLARVGPARIDIAGGQVHMGNGRGALAVSGGAIAASIEAFDPRQVQGDAVWEKISGEVSLDGRLETMQFLDELLGSPPEARIEGGAGDLRIAATIRDGIAHGDAHLVAHQAAVRRPAFTLRGNADVDLKLTRWNLVTGGLDTAGSRVDLSEVSSSGADQSRRWWGGFEAKSGRIGPGLTAQIEAKCRDARPLFTVIGAGLPKWTGGLLELEDLSAAAALTVRPGFLRVRDLDAKGGEFHIRGDYRREGASARGAFLIETKALSVAVEVSESGTILRLLGARSWFEKERAALAAR